MPDRPLLVTSDPDLLDDLLRLCAAAGVEARVAHDVPAARDPWPDAPVVVLGDELSRTALASGLARRSDVVLVGRDLDDEEVWTRAAGLGAESVVFLPEAQSWLVERLAAACREPSNLATTVSVVGGRGGAGASTLACALAVTAAAGGWRTVLVDADPMGGGLDLMLGGELEPGLRWPDLALIGGSVSPSALSSALPRVAGLRLLSWDRGVPRRVGGETAGAVLAAAREANDLVVVDLPRHLDEVAEATLAAADVVLLVVPAELRAVAAAARVAAQLAPLAGDVRVVARGPAPSGLTARQVAGALLLPLAGRLRPEPHLTRGLERGEPPAAGGRGPLADLSRALLHGLSVPRRSAA